MSGWIIELSAYEMNRLRTLGKRMRRDAESLDLLIEHATVIKDDGTGSYPCVTPCPRCDSEVHPAHGCGECSIMESGGTDLLDEIDEHSHREYGRGFNKLDTDDQWKLLFDHN